MEEGGDGRKMEEGGDGRKMEEGGDGRKMEEGGDGRKMEEGGDGRKMEEGGRVEEHDHNHCPQSDAWQTTHIPVLKVFSSSTLSCTRSVREMILIR